MDPRAVVAKVHSIFSLPEVVVRINELIDSNAATNVEIEQVILNDPALTAKLLKFANSSYFGFSGKIDKVLRAISIIGHKELRNLVIASSVTTTFKNIPPNLLNMNLFWKNSVTCGVVARLLSSSVEMRERFFIAGLLHAVGKLILVNQFPKEFAAILSKAHDNEKAIATEEIKTLGFTHACLGAELLKHWKLPLDICKTVEFQFDPALDPQYKLNASVLNAAIHIANYMQSHTNSKIDIEKFSAKHTVESWDFLGLSSDVIESIITVARLQADDLLNIIR